MFSSIILYFKNLGIALYRIPKAFLWIYRYHPSDGYLKNLAVVALDLPGNTLAGGDPDETISSRSGKAEEYELAHGKYGVGCRLCAFLAIFQQDHCQKALNRNKGSRAVVPDESP